MNTYWNRSLWIGGLWLNKSGLIQENLSLSDKKGKKRVHPSLADLKEIHCFVILPFANLSFDRTNTNLSTLNTGDLCLSVNTEMTSSIIEMFLTDSLSIPTRCITGMHLIWFFVLTQQLLIHFKIFKFPVSDNERISTTYWPFTHHIHRFNLLRKNEKADE